MTKLFSLILLGLSLCLSAQAQGYQDRRHFIQLYDGQTVFANKVQYKSPLFKGNYFLLDDSLKYNIEAVNVYQNKEGYFARVSSGGRYDDFAKRIIEGPRISKFYTTRTSYNYGYSPYGYGMSTPSRRRVYYFSKDGGPLFSFNYENLQQALSDNASSMTLLQRHRRDRIIYTAMTVVGAGVTAAGVLSSVNKRDEFGNTELSPAIYVGAGIIAVPVVIQLFRKDKLTQAVEVYNYQIKQ
ncbi:hypothetical protein [Pontibacter ruber]|uniref:Uncharacterized protein n=1 Tax=Pontibacter ruber TaxID=1343895 RepID=A0ABW5CWT1_9BACT|nr:hypothetical protein [Pontibacter ruber]